MIDRQHGKLIFECDCCSDTFEPETSDFAEGWTAAKADGWTATKLGKEWVHRCPNCGAIVL